MLPLPVALFALIALAPSVESSPSPPPIGVEKPVKPPRPATPVRPEMPAASTIDDEPEPVTNRPLATLPPRAIEPISPAFMEASLVLLSPTGGDVRADDGQREFGAQAGVQVAVRAQPADRVVLAPHFRLAGGGVAGARYPSLTDDGRRGSLSGGLGISSRVRFTPSRSIAGFVRVGGELGWTRRREAIRVSGRSGFGEFLNLLNGGCSGSDDWNDEDDCDPEDEAHWDTIARARYATFSSYAAVGLEVFSDDDVGFGFEVGPYVTHMPTRVSQVDDGYRAPGFTADPFEDDPTVFGVRAAITVALR